jgi:hypothetical protein
MKNKTSLKNLKINFRVKDIRKLMEARPLDVDWGDTPAQTEKPKEVSKLKRFSSLFDDPSPETTTDNPERIKSNLLKAKQFAGTQHNTGGGISNNVVQVLYAGDENGNETTIDNCEFAILYTNPPLKTTSRYSSETPRIGNGYVLLYKGLIYSIDDSGGHTSLPQEINKKLYQYFLKNTGGNNSEITLMMINSDGNLPVKSSESTLVQISYNKAEPNKPKTTGVDVRGNSPVDVLKKLIKPYKDGGLGLGSTLVDKYGEASTTISTSTRSALSHQQRQARTEITKLVGEIDAIRWRTAGGPNNFTGIEHNGKELNYNEAKNLEKELISKIEQLRSSAGYESSASELAGYKSSVSKSEGPKQSEKVWADRGLTLLGSKFTKGVSFETSAPTKPTQTSATDEDTVDIDDLLM